MAWSTPDTSWANGDVVSAAVFQALNENIEWLKHHNWQHAIRTTSTVLSSTSRAQIHSSLDLTFTMAVANAPVLLGLFFDGVGGGGVAVIEFSMFLDGSFSHVVGSKRFAATNEEVNTLFTFLTPSAGSRTFSWRYDNTSAANNPTLGRMTTFAIEFGT